MRPINQTRTIPGATGAAAGWRTEIRALVTLAVPLVFTHLAYMAIGLTDVVMMGWLGPRSLAAGTLAIHFYSLFSFIGLGVVSAVAPILAQAIGARRFRPVRRTVRQGFWVALAIALPSFAVIWQAQAIFLLFGQSSEVALAAETYLQVALWGLLPILWYVVLSEFVVAHSRPRAPLVVAVLGIGVNALGNYCLMFGNFGFPRLELVGAALSSLIVESFMFLGLLGFVLLDRRFRRYAILGRIWRPDWPRFAEIFRVGLPIAMAMVAEGSLFLASGFLIGVIGTMQLAGHAIALECVAVAFVVSLGIGQAATVRVGLAVGAGDPVGVRRAGWAALACGGLYAILPATLFWFLARPIVALFLDLDVAENLPAAAFAVSFLTLAAVFQFVDSAQAIAMAVLRGLKDTRVPMAIAVVGYWVFGFGAALAFGFGLDFGGVGVWAGFAIGLACVAVMLIWRFARLTNATPETRPRPGAKSAER